MVTGDEAACREARHFLGDQIITVAVKEGYSRENCRMIPPQRARIMIRQAAAEALGRVSVCRPYHLDLPIRARMDRLPSLLPDSAPPEEVAAAPRHTVERLCHTQLDILRFD